MTKKPDGGPAFPRSPAAGAAAQGQIGMTLRQWYAGQALVGLLLSDELARAQVNPGGRYTSPTEFAEAAVRLADAMIAEESNQ